MEDKKILKILKVISIIIFIIGYVYLTFFELEEVSFNVYDFSGNNSVLIVYTIFILLVLPTYCSFKVFEKLVKIRKYLILLALFLSFAVSLFFCSIVYMPINPFYGEWMFILIVPASYINILIDIFLFIFFLIKIIINHKIKKEMSVN